MNKLNEKFLYANILIIGGLLLTVAASAFTGPGSGTPPAQNASGVFSLTQGGTGAANASDARTALGLGSIAVLNSPLPVANGGTASTSASAARSALGAAGSGSNSDITSLSGLTTPLSVAQGGTGAGTLTGLLIGNGTGAISVLSPGTSGNVLTSNGSAWASTAPSGGSYVDLSSDQTVNGTKTFGSIPVLPASDPTSANQAARKSYVDNLVAMSSGTADGGKLTYYRRGKLYYGFWYANSTPGLVYYDGYGCTNSSGTAYRVATFLGITANTCYTGQVYGQATYYYWNGSQMWAATGSNQWTFLTAILAN